MFGGHRRRCKMRIVYITHVPDAAVNYLYRISYCRRLRGRLTAVFRCAASGEDTGEAAAHDNDDGDLGADDVIWQYKKKKKADERSTFSAQTGRTAGYHGKNVGTDDGYI